MQFSNKIISASGSIFISLTLLLLALNTKAQITEPVFINLVNPLKVSNTVTSSRQFIIGSTCTACTLSINEQPVKVYSSGGFAFEINLSDGDSVFNMMAIAPRGKLITKTVQYIYTPAPRPRPVVSLDIEKIETFPAGNLVLASGNKIEFKVKALPGSTVTTINGTRLYEMPISQTAGMPGIYQGEYIIKPTDSFSSIKIPVTLISIDSNRVSKETINTFSVMLPFGSDIAVTTGRLAYLKYGLGDDRLGGAKMGYLDSLIPLKIVGKVGSDYKIQLAKTRTAYIPDHLVTLMPKGSFAPSSLTTSWKAYGDESFDYVNIGLSSRLPYQSMQMINPNRIVVDIFGTTNNTNWITQLQSVKEIENVEYEQAADDIFRVTIYLKYKQHWGHQVYYMGNTLVVKIRQQPKSLLLKDMTIAVDAGHGGSNTGAGGPTGVLEKVLNLKVALKLQQSLLNEGAKVIMTRTTERLVENNDRILFYQDSLPDMLVSIHMNSASDPIRTGGTSTLYRYIGFRPLSYYINKRMLELGLKEYGNIGSFNFILNSPTEYPNALVETLFLSNPAEEMLILDEKFQQQVADKIILGIKDFLVNAATNK